jgi:hypothetical protein
MIFSRLFHIATIAAGLIAAPGTATNRMTDWRKTLNWMLAVRG